MSWRGIGKKRGQISLEYLILVGFITFYIIGILSLGIFYSGQILDIIRSYQIENFANKIISSAEEVSFRGEPSKATILVQLPDGVDGIEIVEDKLVFNYSSRGGYTRVAYPSDVAISGSLSSSSGVKKIEILASSVSTTIREIE